MACSKMDQCPTENIFCSKQSIKFRRERSLKEIFEDFVSKDYEPEKAKRKMIAHEPQFRKICQNLKLHLGSDTIETDVFKGIRSVSKRDFEKDLKSGRIRIFVPQTFLSKFPHVYQYNEFIEKINELKVIQDINELRSKLETENDLGKRERMSEKLAENMDKFSRNQFYTTIRDLDEEEVKMVKSIQVVKGERAEKKMFKAIQNYFSKVEEEVVVLYSVNFMGSVEERNIKPVEKDFIILNLTKRYIMPLEVKMNFNIASLKKAVKQVKGAMEIIDEWVGGDLTEECGWRYIPAICFENEIPEIEEELCIESLKFIINGSDDIDDQVEKMFSEIPESLQNHTEKAREEFIKVAEFLLFFASFEPVITPYGLPQKVAENVDKGGQVKFIDMWRCWTPNQLPLLKGNLPKVMFLSAPSTGKTALMEAKAFQAMQNGLNVLFLLPFALFDRAKTLLTLKMQQQWKILKEKHGWQNNFHVFSVKRKVYYPFDIDFEQMKQLIQSDEFQDAAIFADELKIKNNNDLQALTEIATMCEHRTIWLAITYIYTIRVTKQKIKSDFEMQNFHIPELVNPIRNSKGIVKFAYPSIKEDQSTLDGQNVHQIEVSGSGSGVGNPDPAAKVSSELALPIDLSESVEEVCLIHEDSNLSNFQTSVLNLVENEQRVLMILPYYGEKIYLVERKLPQDSFIVHKLNEANEEEACEWISGRSSNKFLIADQQTVAGYEFDTVIIVAPEYAKDLISSMCQRATARLIVCLYKKDVENETSSDSKNPCVCC